MFIPSTPSLFIRVGGVVVRVRGDGWVTDVFGFLSPQQEQGKEKEWEVLVVYVVVEDARA